MSIEVGERLGKVRAREEEPRHNHPTDHRFLGTASSRSI